MIDAPDASSTRPYLIRALYEWCTDNGFTPYIAVAVDDSVQVPREYVKDGEIILNIGFDATSALTLGNDYVEFKARFAGTAREIMVPVNRILAIYARENGQGMAFPLDTPKGITRMTVASKNLVSVPEASAAVQSEIKLVQSASVELNLENDDSNQQPEPPRTPPAGTRPILKRVK